MPATGAPLSLSTANARAGGENDSLHLDKKIVIKPTAAMPAAYQFQRCAMR